MNRAAKNSRMVSFKEVQLQTATLELCHGIEILASKLKFKFRRYITGTMI